jgi:hypothetical protein
MAADYNQQIYQKPQVRRAVLAFMSGLDKEKQVQGAEHGQVQLPIQ